MNSQEKSKVRIKALMKELDRQQLEVKKKKNLIRLIISVIVLVTFGFVYNAANKSEARPLQAKRVDGDLVRDVKIETKQVATYQLIFDGLNQYPLARFFNRDEALSFQMEMKRLHLPETKISIDSLDGKERVVALSSNYRYYIQVGIFRKQLLSYSPANMVFLHQIQDKNLYKYRIGPFAKSSQAKKLVKLLNLKDYVILEVSK